MSKVPPISFSTRRTSSAGTVAPPDTTSRSDRRSRPGNVGSSRQASSIVGTSSVADPPSCSTRLKNRAGSNQGASTIRPRACTGPSVASTQPAVWNIGIGLTQASSGPKPRRCMLNRELLVMARWASRAPFGNPVVPDVYWIWAGSSGVTSGSAPPAAAKASPEARNSSKRVRSTTSRSSGVAQDAAHGRVEDGLGGIGREVRGLKRHGGIIPRMKMLSRVLVLAGAAAVLGSVTLPWVTIKGAPLHLDLLGAGTSPLSQTVSGTDTKAWRSVVGVGAGMAALALFGLARQLTLALGRPPT